MLNGIFYFLIVASVLTAAFSGTMAQVSQESLNAAKAAVTLAIGLIGQMAMWLGFMAILREAGLMRSMARGLAPVMRRLFPSVPPEHPAMGAMIMNIAANMLGLGNAATPFGLKAMIELDKLNKNKGTATNAMVLFLAINTSGVAVLPLGVVAIRATLGSQDAAGIVIPSLLASACATVMAVLFAKLLERSGWFGRDEGRPNSAEVSGVEGPEGPSSEQSSISGSQKTSKSAVGSAPNAPDEKVAGLDEAERIAALSGEKGGWRQLLSAGVALALVVALFRHIFLESQGHNSFDVAREVFSDWLLPVLMATIVLFGFGRRIKVYEVFVAGAKEGFQIAVMVIPFLVAILVAIGMFRASGGMDFFVATLSPITSFFGMPAEALPMALIRPLSGSGAMGVMSETMTTHGPDSFVGYLVSIINGSTETTFYVLAVYFGAVQVRATRHTVYACLAADFTGVAAAVALAHLFFG